MSNLKKILINKNICKSVWFMRQAGRYLPEFRKIRSQNQNFIELCLDSDLSSEITLQPIKRFNLDAAIIFSDILVIPHALGQSIEFRGKRGPRCQNFSINKFLEIKDKEFLSALQPTYKTVQKTKKSLHRDKSLIAFIGAPWTLITYLFNLKDQVNSNNKVDIKGMAKGDMIVANINKIKKLSII